MESVVFICPTCKGKYHKHKDALECRNSHYPTTETWLNCKCGFGVRCDGYVMAPRVEEFERHKKQCQFRRLEKI
jgi:hypothetical protein